MRVLVVISPLIAYPITYRICKELQHTQGSGKRKTANIVTRSEDGEYIVTSSPVYVDDVHHGLAAVEVPRFISPAPDEESETSGTRVVER
jgi:hypothetical protein